MFKSSIRSLVMAFVLGASTLAVASPYSALYVFGDSLSDNGNIPASLPADRPSAPYADGRFSNGPIAVEYMAASLGIPLFDYAVGGATSGTSNPDVAAMADSGVLSQVNAFAGAHMSGVDPNALYMIWAGANDILDGGTPDDAVANILSEIATLRALGAQHFFVPNMANLGITPYALQDPAAAADATAASVAFDTLLAASLPGDVIQFDTFSLLAEVLANPANYGFSNVTATCFDGTTVCSDPSSYLFWDDLHATTATHRLLASQFVAAVPEPASITLLGGALLTMAGLRKSKGQ